MRGRQYGSIFLIVALTAVTLHAVPTAKGQAGAPVAPSLKTLMAERPYEMTARLRRIEPLWVDRSMAGPGRRRVPAITGASGLAQIGDWTFVAQDDSTLLAAIDRKRTIQTVRLFESIDGADRFHDALGNKKVKPDLEAISVIQIPAAAAAALFGIDLKAPFVEGLLVLGSGSVARHRERAALVIPGDPLSTSRVAPIEARALYARLRASAELTAGNTLNIEGLAVVDAGRTARFFNRGNGPAGSVTASVDVPVRALLDYLVKAAADPDAPFDASLVNPVRYALGSTGIVPISLGDATVLDPDDTGEGEVLLVALVSEDTDDPTKDGLTSGSHLGLQLPGGRMIMAPLLEETGPSSLKIEGLAVRSVKWQGPASAPRYAKLTVVGVVDSDPTDPTIPSSLVEVDIVYAPKR